ncbi:MAG: hypothetical protein WKF67_12025 [Rubrobacteraceae bacterium]
MYQTRRPPAGQRREQFGVPPTPTTCAAGISSRYSGGRHTCATLLLTKGVHPKIVSELLGHANIFITLDTYSYVILGLGDTAASAMENALRPKNDGEDADDGVGDLEPQ